MSEAGRPSKLDNHLFRKIKELVLDGMNLRQIAEILEIPYATMRDWQYENYEGFADNTLAYKHQRMLDTAETEIEVLQKAEDEKVRLQANIHVSETLGKRYWSKRSEITGKDGKDLPVPILNVQGNNIYKENSETKEEN